MASVSVTLDGFMEGPNGELNWRNGDQEVENGMETSIPSST
jgi:hypothetical protein